jgi:hypothetical protein
MMVNSLPTSQTEIYTPQLKKIFEANIEKVLNKTINYVQNIYFLAALFFWENACPTVPKIS